MSVQEDFSAAGAMFRGDTPRNRLRLLSSDAVYAVSSKTANVTINSLRLDNVHQAAQKFVLKVTLAGHSATSEGQQNGGGEGRIQAFCSRRAFPNFTTTTNNNNNPICKAP